MFAKEDKSRLALLFFGILILGFTEMIGVASIVPFMGMVTDSSMIMTNSYLNYIYVNLEFESTDDFLFFSGVAVLCLMAISNLFSIFMNWNMQSFVFLQEHRIACRMIQKYLSQEYLFFLSRNSSDLSKNILTEVGRAMSGVVLPILQVLSKFIVTFMLVLLLVIADPFLAGTILLTLGSIYIFIFIIVRKVLHSIGNIAANAISARYKILSEIFSRIKILKLKGGENEFVKWFSIPSLKYAKFSAMSTVISHAPRYLLEIVAFGGIMIIVLYLISKDQSNSYVISYMSLYAFAGYRLMPALQQIYAGLTLVQYNFPAVEAISNDLKLKEAKNLTQKISPDEDSVFNHSIDLTGISFKYPGANKYLLNGIDISIKKNSSIAIVGETGSGKSTLIDIILGLHTPDEGLICIDGFVLNEKTSMNWKRNIGYVPQDIYLSDDTIQKNIAFLAQEKDISQIDVINAAKTAYVHDFIMELPEQYNTKVGERGVRLSGGQKQRIGIARALYENPHVLVLDEATSAMDSITEELVMNALVSLKNKKTMVMIAHRLTTIKNCDIIYILEDGHIVDAGNYDELLATNIKFQRMAKK